MARLKLAIIGTGGMGRGHVHAALQSPDFELVAACDVQPAALEALPPGVLTTTRADELFAQRAIDAVSLILPNDLYEPHVKLAVARGVHVLCEKPLGHSLASARAMLETVRQAGAQGHVGGQFKYCPHFVAALPRIRALPVRYVSGGNFFYSEALRRGGDFGWRRDVARSGGLALMINGWHSLDFLHHCLGTPRQVQAQMLWDDAHPGIDLYAQLLLEYPTGVRADVLCDIAAPVYDFRFTFNALRESVDLSVHGARYFQGPQLTEHRPHTKNDAAMLAQLYAEWAKALRGQPAYITTFEQAVQVMQVVDAGYRAARQGRAVTLD